MVNESPCPPKNNHTVPQSIPHFNECFQDGEISIKWNTGINPKNAKSGIKENPKGYKIALRISRTNNCHLGELRNWGNDCGKMIPLPSNGLDLVDLLFCFKFCVAFLLDLVFFDFIVMENKNLPLH